MLYCYRSLQPSPNFRQQHLMNDKAVKVLCSCPAAWSHNTKAASDALLLAFGSVTASAVSEHRAGASSLLNQSDCRPPQIAGM